MPIYAYADLLISSSLPLVELPHIEQEKPEPTPSFTFKILQASKNEPLEDEWIHHWQNTLSLARTSEGFLLRFPRLADFIISEDGSQIAGWPVHGTNHTTLRHLFLDQVLPRLMAHQGKLVLHASAVRVGNHVIALAGRSGYGKSTLAAGFHRSGIPIFCDDGLVLTVENDCPVAFATYTGLRLWPKSVGSLFSRPPELAPMAHYSSKQRVLFSGKNRPSHLPLECLYILTDDETDTVTLTPLSKREACMEIIRHSFQFDVSSQKQLSSLLGISSEISTLLPVFTISYPREFNCLPLVQAHILSHLEQSEGSCLGNLDRGSEALHVYS